MKYPVLAAFPVMATGLAAHASFLNASHRLTAQSKVFQTLTRSKYHQKKSRP